MGEGAPVEISAEEFGKLVPSDNDSYGLDIAELEFFRAQTGILDENELRAHIFEVRDDAYKVHPYPCIRRFVFTKLKISRLPAYPHLLRLGRERKGAIFLDIGCCVGNDVRKAVFDGYPVENAIASDLQPEFWELGHKLFKSTPETFPVPFIPGDAFDPSFIEPVPPFHSPPETPRPDLHSLTTLTPLLGHVSAIHASSFFHLFDEAKQTQLAHSLAGLLSPEPGSMIFGMHIALPVKGLRIKGRKSAMFCHSPESWAELWDGAVFSKGTVKVDTIMNSKEDPDQGLMHVMGWSVTRL